MNKLPGCSIRVRCIVSKMPRKISERSWLECTDCCAYTANGIALQCKGAGEIIRAAKVDGYPNTLQIIFSSNLPPDGIILQASCNSGSSPEDVSWNGRALDQRVAPPRGKGGARKTPVRGAPVGAAVVETPSTTPQRSGSDTKAKQNGQPSRSLATQQQLAKVSEVATDLATVHRVPVDSKGRRQLPDDAMLILTQDLYL